MGYLVVSWLVASSSFVLAQHLQHQSDRLQDGRTTLLNQLALHSPHPYQSYPIFTATENLSDLTFLLSGYR